MMYVYINGNFVEGDKAVISVRDRGFRFGDGLFETIRVEGGQPYQWDLHIKRLTEGLRQVKITADISSLSNICNELLAKNNVTDGFLRVSISRGEGSKGYLPDVKGGSIIIVETVDPAPAITDSVSLWISSYRKIPKACLPIAKTAQGLNPALARMEAAENDCFEALLFDVDGNICEGSSSNIFWIKDNILFTPSLDLDVLPGTIRDAIIRLSPFEVQQGVFQLKNLEQAEEIFLTNAAWLIAPVNAIQPENLNFDRFTLINKLKDLLNADTKNN